MGNKHHILFGALVVMAVTRSMAGDDVSQQIEKLRKSRGQAIAQANKNFEQWLDQAIETARTLKRDAELRRLQEIKKQIHEETDSMAKDGDKRVLIPTTKEQLRSYLIGTKWNHPTKVATIREFTVEGKFTSKDGAADFDATSANEVKLTWPKGYVSTCEFNEDHTTMKELPGKVVWHKVP